MVLCIIIRKPTFAKGNLKQANVTKLINHDWFRNSRFRIYIFSWIYVFFWLKVVWKWFIITRSHLNQPWLYEQWIMQLARNRLCSILQRMIDGMIANRITDGTKLPIMSGWIRADLRKSDKIGILCFWCRHVWASKNCLFLENFRNVRSEIVAFTENRSQKLYFFFRIFFWELSNCSANPKYIVENSLWRIKTKNVPSQNWGIEIRKFTLSPSGLPAVWPWDASAPRSCPWRRRPVRRKMSASRTGRAGSRGGSRIAARGCCNPRPRSPLKWGANFDPRSLRPCRRLRKKFEISRIRKMSI